MSGVFRSIMESAAHVEQLNFGKRRFQLIDMHTGGEPLRVIISGMPHLPGRTILEKRSELASNYDHIRKLLMWEPRGHADMYGCLIVEPERPDSDFGVIFMHNEGYSTMCGHATIAITRLVAQMNWAQKSADGMRLQIDAPCGVITSRVESSDLKGEFAVSFVGVPSFTLCTDQVIQIPHFGQIDYDIAYGGAFYAYVDADRIGLSLTSDNIGKITSLGRQIKSSIINSPTRIEHPLSEDLGFLYGVIFRSRKTSTSADFRNVCVFANGEVDRSPTGSGLCGFLALLISRGWIDPMSDLILESIIGSRFKGNVISRTEFAGLPAIFPKVAGNAYITAKQDIYLDDDDPIRGGFLIH